MSHPDASAVVSRRPIVGVMGSHRAPCADRARPLGAWIARRGYHLLTGAGAGVMASVCQAFAEVPDRAGLSIGVVPTRPAGDQWIPLAGYPNPWVELPIVSQLDEGGPAGDELHSRNHVNILTATVVVVLPGDGGTASEARLARRYGRPCVGFLRERDEVPGAPDDLPLRPTLDGVTAFVAEAVRRADQSGRTIR